MNLSKRLEAAMRHKGVTNKSEIARAGGVSTSAISQILSGDTKTLKSTTALLIADFCGVSARWLSDGAGSMCADNTTCETSTSFQSDSSPIISQLVARGWSLQALADLCEVKPQKLKSAKDPGVVLASTSCMKLVDLYRLNVTFEQMRRVVQAAVEQDRS